MDSKITIRKIKPEELEVLLSLASLSFHQAFAEQNTPENMEAYMSEAFTLEQFRIELENPDSEFYFAEYEGEIAAYLKINFGKAQTELQESDGMEVQRIYMPVEFYGKNIGKVLLDKAMERAKEENMRYVWLGVWEKNLRAQRFYEKNGFKKFSAHTFIMGDDPQTDFLLKIDLR
jgi:diamine N-acetyltransferase